MTNGKIYTFSILYSTTEKYAHLIPYATAIIELEDGTRLPVLLQGYTEGTEVYVGQEVKYMGESESGDPIYSL